MFPDRARAVAYLALAEARATPPCPDTPEARAAWREQLRETHRHYLTGPQIVAVGTDALDAIRRAVASGAHPGDEHQDAAILDTVVHGCASRFVRTPYGLVWIDLGA
ncbi:hypothetical protein [Streptomyces chrestomyceticus]|uniref:hypothetical protein n=1 Tax=Streptomyces chrestomyceticus TaxID=68185 RepID=UPI0033C50DEA